MNLDPFVAALALVLALPCCTLAGTSLPSRCEAIEVDPMRELVVTDAIVTASPRVRFARIMGAALGAESDAAARAWMDAWAEVPGEETLQAEVIDPWDASSPRGLDLSRAPFELIAISNRIDLSTLGPGRAGEIRFVYGLVTSNVRRPLTVIVELQLPNVRSVGDWATTWHALGSLTGAAYSEALFAIVDAVLEEPLYGQVRTQDARAPGPILLEFDLRNGALLVPSGLFNQPRPGMNSRELTAFVSTHEDEILTDAQVLPRAMLARSIQAVAPRFALPGVPANVAKAFTDATCSGCHTAEPTLDGTFHISPLRRGIAALSPFLVDSSGGKPDELSRRAEVLRGLLCQR
jgi:hypothetical protein